MRSTIDFEHVLQLWEKKPSYDKTWTGFKTHFHNAEHDLKITRGTTMNQAGCHHANSMVSQIRVDTNDQLESRNNEVISILHSIPSLISSSSDSENSQDPPTHHAKSATTDMIQL